MADILLQRSPTDPRPVDLGPSSRFQFSQPILYEGQETYGAWAAPWFIKDPDRLPPESVGTLTVAAGADCRPDLISYQVYGTPYLDWVIIAFNRPRDVLNWPRPGTVIRYPKPDVVHRYID